MDYAQAISTLYPNASWSMDGESYEGLWWFAGNEDPKPSEALLKKEIRRLKKENKKKEYMDQRKNAYPSVEDQLDMLWHMMDREEIPGKFGVWYSEIMLVKSRYSKENQV